MTEVAEPPPLADPAEVLRLLQAGDRLAHCLATGWRLIRADVEVDAAAVDALHGRLVPLDDGLPGIGQAQTWIWAEK